MANLSNLSWVAASEATVQIQTDGTPRHLCTPVGFDAVNEDAALARVRRNQARVISERAGEEIAVRASRHTIS
jgi:hypothetical protein